MPSTTGATENVSTETVRLAEIIGIIWRRKLVILTYAFAFAVIGVLMTVFVQKEKFQSTARLVIQFNTQPISSEIENVVTGISSDAAAINTEISILTSRSLASELIDAMALMEDPEFNTDLSKPGLLSQAVEAMQLQLLGPPDPMPDEILQERLRNRAISRVERAVTVTNPRNTYVFNVSVRANDPVKSKDMANTLANLYVQRQIDMKFNATETAVTWLAERVTELEGELLEKENKRKEVLSELEITTPQQLEVLAFRLSEMRARQSETEGELARVRARLVDAQTTGANGSSEEQAAFWQDQALNRLLQTSPLTGDSRQRFDDRVAFLVLQIRTDLNQLEAQQDTLQQAVSDMNAQFVLQSDALVGLQQMQREFEATRILYETFLSRLKEASVQRGIQQADSQVLSHAMLGDQVEPRRRFTVMSMALVGGLLGTGIVLVFQLLYRGVRTSAELEALTQLPVIGEIAQLSLRRRQDLLTYIRDNPASQFVESLRNLRTSIMFAGPDDTQKVLLFTSTVPGEGKTTLSVSMAMQYASLEKRVLLIDCDIRRQTLLEYVGHKKPSTTLGAVLRHPERARECIFHEDTLGLDVMSFEKGKTNPADLFASPDFGRLVARMRDAYDYVILDTPPVLIVADSRIVARHADSVVVVVHWNSTSQRQLMMALSELQKVNISTTGLVLSKIKKRQMQRYGYEEYGSYGAGYYSHY